MATTTPNFGWAVPTSTDLVKDGAVAIETLGDSIDASLVDLKGGTTGQVLAKASNTDMDFSWVAQDDSNAIQNAIVDAKGDLIAATANDTPARLAVGANDLILTADSTQATGLTYTGAWTTWTPTYSNLTIGNGTVIARYQKVGKNVNLYWSFTLGSTSSVGSGPSITLPINHSQTGAILNLGCQDEGVARYFGKGVLFDNVCYLQAINTAGTYALQATITSTIPFTWGNTDRFVLSGSYEVA